MTNIRSRDIFDVGYNNCSTTELLPSPVFHFRDRFLLALFPHTYAFEMQLWEKTMVYNYLQFLLSFWWYEGLILYRSSERESGFISSHFLALHVSHLSVFVFWSFTVPFFYVDLIHCLLLRNLLYFLPSLTFFPLLLVLSHTKIGNKKLYESLVECYFWIKMIQFIYKCTFIIGICSVACSYHKTYYAR